MHALLPTDGHPPAKAAQSLLAAIADPARVTVTVLHVDECGNQLVADRVAKSVLGQSLEHLQAVGIDLESKRAGGGVKHAIEQELEGGARTRRDGIGNTSWLGRLVLGGSARCVALFEVPGAGRASAADRRT